MRIDGHTGRPIGNFRSQKRATAPNIHRVVQNGIARIGNEIDVEQNSTTFIISGNNYHYYGNFSFSCFLHAALRLVRLNGQYQ